jgi:hypothetical protein
MKDSELWSGPQLPKPDKPPPMTSQTAAIAIHPARPLVFALLLVTAGGALTGFSPIFARLSEAGPLATAGWRMAIASATSHS